MAIDFKCPHCGRDFSAAESNAGKRARCAACKNELTIPTPPLAVPKPSRPTTAPAAAAKHSAAHAEEKISVACACGREFRFAKSAVGKIGKCDRCGAQFRVSLPTPASTEIIDDLEELPDPIADPAFDDLLSQGVALAQQARPLAGYQAPQPAYQKPRKNLGSLMHAGLILPVLTASLPIATGVMVLIILYSSPHTNFERGRVLAGTGACFMTWPVALLKIMGQPRLFQALIAGASPFFLLGLLLMAIGVMDPAGGALNPAGANLVQPAGAVDAPLANATSDVLQWEPPKLTSQGEEKTADYFPNYGGERQHFLVSMPGRAVAPQSLPCCIIALEHCDLLDRQPLGADRQPTLKLFDEIDSKRFCIVAYHVPGYGRDRGRPGLNNDDLLMAINEHRKADCGMANGRWAIDLALRQPEVNPQQIYTAGEGLGATYALLLAAHDKRLRGCLVKSPVVDLQQYYPADRVAQASSQFGDMQPIVTRMSPMTHCERIQCPVFFGPQTSREQGQATATMQDKLRQAGIDFTAVSTTDNVESFLKRYGAIP